MAVNARSGVLRLLPSLAAAVLLLLLVLAGAQMSSPVAAAPDVRPLNWKNPPGDPEIGAITLTADIALYDTAPEGLTRTVYFNNKSAGMITVTAAVTGTPTLTLTGGIAFEKATETRVTSGHAPFEGVITYMVQTGHGTQPGVLFTATTTRSVVSVPITFVQDITAPVVAVSTTASHLATTTFPLYWSAQDSPLGSGVRDYVVSYYTATGLAGWHVLQSGGLTSSLLFSAVDDKVSYTFVVTAHDQVGNASGATWSVYIARSWLHLPVVVRDYNPFSNGDFSSDLSGWNYGGDNSFTVTPVTRLYRNAQPITGTAALLGGVDSDECRTDSGPCYAEGGVPIGSARLWRKLTIPTVGAPSLTINYRIFTHDILRGSVTGKYWDDFEVSLVPPADIVDNTRNAIGCGGGTASGTTILVPVTATLVMCDGYTGTWHDNSLIDLGWKTVTLNLSNFKGQNVTLYFANWNRQDPTANSWTYMDEITLAP